MEPLIWHTEKRRVQELKMWDQNPRTLTQAQAEQLNASLTKFNLVEIPAIDLDNRIIAGHQRVTILLALGRGDEEIDVRVPNRKLTEEEYQEYNLRSNKNTGEWDFEKLANINAELLKLVGFSDKDLGLEPPSETPSIKDRFLFSPFTILDSRRGEWMERKDQWIKLGIQSELGRGDNITFSRSSQSPEVYSLRNEMRAASGLDPTWEEVEAEAARRGVKMLVGTSVFDPVLCELAYRWFSPPGGKIVDPFAGGSVRGVVAAALGRQYFGIDLRAEQVEENKKQWEVLRAKLRPEDGQVPSPSWIADDSRNIKQHIVNDCDMLFTCPPYGDLEVYSDKPEDLSAMDDKEFLLVYEEIIKKSCELLKDNRFACVVVGDYRDSTGQYKNFISNTIDAFLSAGLKYYNEAILIVPLGSLPIRVGKQFTTSRKLGKTHQNVLFFVKGDIQKAVEEAGEFCKLLVFTKGDARAATEAIGPVQIDDLGMSEEAIA